MRCNENPAPAMRWAHSDRLRRRPPTMASIVMSTIRPGSGASPSGATMSITTSRACFGAAALMLARIREAQQSFQS